MQTWEQIALGAVIVVVLFLGLPRIKASMQAAEGKPKDWAGVIVPIVIVVLFVFLLVQLA